MKHTAKILIFAVLVFSNSFLSAQIQNISTFDKNRLHYGIAVGYIQSKFMVEYTTDAAIRENIQGVTSYYLPGFHLSIIGDLRVNDYLNIRLLPGITFIDRDINYSLSEQYLATSHLLDERRTVESVYGDLPIDIKIRSVRWKNFRPYLITGGKVGFDFASLKNNKNKNNESIIRLAPVDVSYTAGVGFDFYFTYFKFAIELKMGFGLLDLKVPDDTYYTQSIESIKSRTFTLSITVEG